MQQVVVGYEVGGGYDQMFFCCIGGGEESLMNKIFWKVWFGGDCVNSMFVGFFEWYDIDVWGWWQNVFVSFYFLVVGVDDVY